MSTSVTTLGPESFSFEVNSTFTLELLHLADQEAASSAVINAPNLSAVLNALRAQDIGNDGQPDNTLTLSSGDQFIPGVFFDASRTAFGSAGIADIQIQNELGIQASAFGNHEFDFGTSVLGNLINGTAAGSIFGTDFGGTAFPYLSANLNFATNTNLNPLRVAGGGAPLPRTVTSSVVLDVNGEKIGVVGATTPTLGRISSPGTVGILPTPFGDTPSSAELDALAAIIQAEVNSLLAADTSLNKIILLAHMQRIGIEQALATRLENVDIIVAGGSNTRLLDEDDRLRAGDSTQGVYPLAIENAGGTTTLVVNTDGSYKYLGRLVIDFDADGNIIPESYDPTVSGAYATDAQGVADLEAEDLVDPEIQAIADAIEAQIVATQSNVFGTSTVYLNGNRSGVAGDADGVRTQETNLGNLTADANLYIAQQTDADVVVSIKNGGGIRASIGQIVVPPGATAPERLPTAEVVDSAGNVLKPEGGISQTDIQTALAFNNGLTLLTVTKVELVAVLEHGVRALPGVAGQFAQVSGVQFSFDPDLPAGDRILNAEIVDADGKNIAYLVRDGEIAGDPAQTFRIVTLNFMADGGDGYPLNALSSPNRVNLVDALAPRTGEATFAADGSEQDALAEYLAALEAPFDEADTPISGDTRMQNLNFRDDAVFAPTVINEVLASTTGTDSEYIELYGEPGASLAGLSFISVESNASGNGTIDFRFDFAADARLGDNGFYLLANLLAESTYGVTANGSINDNSLENSAATYALVRTASLTGTTVTAGIQVLDAVANADAATTNSYFFGAPVVGPDGTFFPAGVGRIADGVDTNAAADFKILNFNNSATVNTPTAGTFDGGGTGGGVTINATPTKISAVQGSADASLLVGQIVVIEAIVTGDFQNGDADMFRSLGGFFLMEEVADRDANALTSEGIFVYEGSGNFMTDVNAGDLVRVLGTVIERFGKTTIQVTEIRIEEPDAADPLSLAVPTELPDLAGREAFESMLVTITEPLTFSESFDYEAFGEATLSSGGEVYQFTQINTPDVAGNAAYLAEVANRQITVDNGTNTSRADFSPITEPDGDLFSSPANALMGQTVSELTAILDYDFAEFRLRLPEGADFTLDPETNAIQTAPEDVGSTYKVGSLNVLNYFTTIGGTTDIGAAPRGADNALELERQTEKLVTTILGMDADVIGLVELENDFAGDDFALKSLVQAINDAREGDDVWSWVDPGREFVGGDAIAVGFIYNTATTALVGNAAILDSADFLDPLGGGLGGDAFNRAALAQSFQDIAGGGIFTASVNHLKSKGSLTGIAADADQGDGAGNNNATRTAAAERLAEWLASDPTGSGDDDVIILGDLNAYARETPIQALEEAGYTDLARAHEGDAVASYRFSGQIGTLDYAMANEALTGQVTGATTWNINSDTPVFFDYNLDGTFTTPLRPTGQGLFDGTDPSRSSDHDPLIVGLNLDDDRPILLTGTTGNDRLNGTAEDEIIDARGGALDVVFGGGGDDTFVFTSQAGRRDSLRVLDYTEGDDVIDLNGATLLSHRVVGGNLVLTLDSDRDIVTLFNVTDIAAVTFADQLMA